MSIAELFFTFFYIGLFTIGGGMVAITLMQQSLVDRGIITAAEFFNMVAVSESTPGPLGINMATYVGYRLYGIPGGIIATAGEVLPSIIVILLIARFLTKFNQNPFVKGALSFLRPVTTGLVLVPVVQIFLLTLVNVPASLSVLSSPAGWMELFRWVNLAAYAVFTFALLKFDLHPVFVIAAGAAFGILRGLAAG